MQCVLQERNDNVAIDFEEFVIICIETIKVRERKRVNEMGKAKQRRPTVTNAVKQIVVKLQCQSNRRSEYAHEHMKH